ncbi:RNA polymerase sigma factor SigB [Nocardiopsis sp. JB363]|nr:RNA polymerase sigma factor SigB [Nocardiopsis sp. JB363]
MHSSVTTLVPVPSTPCEELSPEASAEELLWALQGLDRDGPGAIRLRERVLAHYKPMLNRIARRYRGRGESVEDLCQTAYLGLSKAINGYRPDRGKAFISYLLPTVTGEIKRHFRDHTWAVHTPRGAQSQRPRLRRARQDLEQRLSRTPTNDEIAREMEVTVKEVEEILLVSEAYDTLSLSAPGPRGEESTTTWDRYLGVEDHALDLVVQREAARSALRGLPDREKLILKRSFFDEWKQERIAKEAGCSQMHVSRLLTASLERLRKELAEDDPPGSAPWNRRVGRGS